MDRLITLTKIEGILALIIFVLSMICRSMIMVEIGFIGIAIWLCLDVIIRFKEL